MFDSDNPQVYENVFKDLLKDLSKANLAQKARTLDLNYQQNQVSVPLLNKIYLVSSYGITLDDQKPVPITHRICLSYYLLQAGRGENTGQFVPYRELPGGADFSRSLSQIVEWPLADYFKGKIELLSKKALALGGQITKPEVDCDAAFYFQVLPKIPLLLTFFDEDEDFGAEAKIFYDLCAPNFLDMECLAVLGLIIANELTLS